ncbi:MAG: carboxypeptidase regulatory-like domain-containing protein [Planctomycetaceae bacterium]
MMTSAMRSAQRVICRFWVMAGAASIILAGTGVGGALAADTGSFSGVILFDGNVVELPPLVAAGAAVKDAEVCSAEPVADESLVVGENKGIANVFVYLRRAPKGYKGEAPKEPVVIDQKGCAFVPHAMTIQAGQKVLVKSSDAIQHNLHTVPKRNQSTNLLIKPNEQDGVEIEYRLAEAEPFNVKCDIHAWMSSYHLVLDHPFMAVTDENGKFQIDGLPPGKHEFRVWHERGDVLEKGLKVDVAAGKTEEVTLKYGSDRFPAK